MEESLISNQSIRSLTLKSYSPDIEKLCSEEDYHYYHIIIISFICYIKKEKTEIDIHFLLFIYLFIHFFFFFFGGSRHGRGGKNGSVDTERCRPPVRDTLAL